jgi:hypothetical protein
VRITKRERAHVPWLELARTPEKYLDVDTIPKGFKVLDPSKLTKDRIFDLWCHWSGRARAKLPILIFIEAREQDLGIHARYELEKPSVVKKRVAYVDVGSDDQTGDDELMVQLTRVRGHQGPSTSNPHPSILLRLYFILVTRAYLY